MDSVVGRKVLDCSLRYNKNVDRTSKLEFAPQNINRHAVTPQVELNTSALLLELLQYHDGSLTLFNDNFNTTDITVMNDQHSVYVLTLT